MESVAFYSYKGGVGRSLLTATTARFLAMCGHRVVALDLDLEAPGLHYKFGLPEPTAGAVDVLNAIRSCAHHPDLAELVDQVSLPKGAGSLLVLPAGAAPTVSYWEQVAKLHRLAFATGGGLLEAALELRARIASDLKPDYLLVDSRTGVSELGGLATTAMVDRVVLICTRTAESLHGTAAVANALRRAPRLAGGGDRKLHVVVSRSTPGQSVNNEELTALFGSWFELPHDARDGAIERTTATESRPAAGVEWHAQTISGWAFGTSTEETRAPKSLLAESLMWAGQTFPGLGERADQARRRLVAIDAAEDELTRQSMRLGPVLYRRPAWDAASVRRGYALPGGKRVADLIVHHPHGEVGVVVEYVHDEDPAEVAETWFRNTSARVVAICGAEPVRFGRVGHLGREARNFHVRWTERLLPMPHDLELLHQPADYSLKSLLGAVHRTPHYDGEILRGWARANTLGIHVRGPWDPHSTSLVLDAVARIDDADRFAQFVNRAANIGEPWLEMQYTEETRMRLRALTEIVAPLIWRGPPAALPILGCHARRELLGLSPLMFGLQQLAGHMGLRYDPDALFRAYERENKDTRGGQWMELQFEWHDEPSGTEPAWYLMDQGIIHLARPAIEGAASRLGVPARAVGSVLAMWYAVRGLLCVSEDIDGYVCKGAHCDGNSRLENALIGAVVDRALETLGDPLLRSAFGKIDTLLPEGHGSWRALKSASSEALRHAILTMRRGYLPTLALDAMAHDRQ